MAENCACACVGVSIGRVRSVVSIARRCLCDSDLDTSAALQIHDGDHLIYHDLILATRRSKLTGIERFAVNVFEASRSHSDRVIALVSPTSNLVGQPQVLAMPSTLVSWLQLARLLKGQRGTNAIVCAAFPASPSLMATSLPIARVVHDAFAWTRSQDLTMQGRLMFTHLDRLLMKRYNFVMAPTAEARRDLQSVFHKAKIEICGNAPGLDVCTGDVEAIAGLVPSGFVLAVGTIEPRKNYERLIALASLPNFPHKLVVAGRPGWGGSTEMMLRARDVLGERLLWLAGASDANLRWLYRNCHSFMSLSHAEGFNMPLVEAGISGCKIICSDLAIHREVAAPWARLVKAGADDDAVLTTLRDAGVATKPALDHYRSRFNWASVAMNIEAPLNSARY